MGSPQPGAAAHGHAPTPTPARLIPMDVWVRQLFGDYAPHRNTLYNWRRHGLIHPEPVKIGNRYFCTPDARVLPAGTVMPPTDVRG